MDLNHMIELLTQNVMALTNQVSKLTLLAESLMLQKNNGNDHCKLLSKVEAFPKSDAPTERLDNGGWYDAKGICELFPILSFNKVKSRQWRTANHFPQNGEPFCKQRYNSSEISRWIDENMVKK